VVVVSGAGGQPSILVIEDDEEVRSFISSRLTAGDFDVTTAPSGERALEVLDGSIDVVILDLGLPGMDGFSVVRSIRRQSMVPILIVSGAVDEADRVLGLELGADDYVVKPFLPRELIARVRALLRRSAHTAIGEQVSRFGEITLDLRAHEVYRDGQKLPLTNKELELLRFLSSSPRQVFSREQLLRHVWEAEPGWQDVATVTEHVHRLRRHIEVDPTQPRHIVTVRGAGYRFDP
jgi:two-component system, OmpR family, phosphate regulon response regulator PhoB